jgi:hypothetical protein
VSVEYIKLNKTTAAPGEFVTGEYKLVNNSDREIIVHVEVTLDGQMIAPFPIVETVAAHGYNITPFGFYAPKNPGSYRVCVNAVVIG